MIHALVLLSGLAALSWEVLWQLKATLALGISAQGTAITLATTMAGMAAGSYLASRLVRGPLRPLATYALLELVIGLSGLLLAPGFALLEWLDALLYQAWPSGTYLLQLAGIAALLGLPAAAMGATIPVLGLVARQYATSLPVLYGLNTFGAAVGCLMQALLLIPWLGVQGCIYLICLINLAVVSAALTLDRRQPRAAEFAHAAESDPPVGNLELAAVGLSGAATFCLEVAWFRALRAAFQTTSASFAVMLAAVLVALAVGARLARRITLPQALFGSGLAILVATPLVERFDQFAPRGGNYYLLLGHWLLLTLLALGPAVVLLGAVLPGLLGRHGGLSNWARLYCVNTLGAVAGSLGAAWLLLPTLGFVASAWLTGLAVGAFGLALQPRLRAGLALALALLLAWVAQSGIGTRRVPSRPDFEKRIVAFFEAPDSQVAVVEKLSNRSLCLLIDGFVASSQQSNGHYMAWMGRVPMLLHPNPRTALVICFGTGQTINAVRQEGCDWADVVDVNRRVLQCAPLFTANQGVLQDPRVHASVMDGRAWLRRARRRYDVITLEPMPPRMAGVNGLYCEEFYRLAAARLNPGGIVAQWLPFHLQSPRYSIAIARTFGKVFGDWFIWQDPRGDCILVGRVKSGAPSPLGTVWPGLQRPASGRDMSPAEILAAAWLREPALSRYLALGNGEVITDDNQLLAYGGELRFSSAYFNENQLRVEWAHNLSWVERAESLAQGALRAELQRVKDEMQSFQWQPDWTAVKAARQELRPRGPSPLLEALDRLRI